MAVLSAGQRKVALFCAAYVLASISLFLVVAHPSRILPARLVRVVRRALKQDWVDPDRRAPAGTKYRTFFSPTAQREVSYLIYLPPGYDSAPENRYPVIYWLHGRGGTQREGAYTFVPGMAAAMQFGKAPPVIIVLLNGLGESRWCDSPDGKRPVESVIVHDLIPHIDSTYRTRATRQYRAIEGFSMGGFGAPHLAFKYPELFGAVAIDSGALFDETRDPESLRANSPWDLVARNADRIRGRTTIRIAVGDEDQLFEFNRKFHLLLETLGIEHEFVVLPGVAHNEEMIYMMLGPRVSSFYAKAFGD